MFTKEAYIKQIGPKKFRVYSEKGRNMGTYSSRSAAKERLKDIEFFKHKNSVDDNHVMPRGGVGGVPPFFRKNLDYGEREEVLKKKIKKLKSVRSALQNLGFKKEASEVRGGIKSLLLSAFLAITGVAGGIIGLNQSLTDGVLRRAADDFALEESPNLEEKKMVFEIGTPTDTIIDTVYSDLPVKNKKEIIKEFLKEYNPNLSFEDETLKLKEEEIFKHTHRAEVAYPDLKNVMDKFIRRLSSGYTPSEVGKAGEMSISPEGLDFIMRSEGFSEKIYNDDRQFVWPRDKDNKKAKGHWTIGYGHQLLPKELESGIIEVSPTDRIRWTDGITEEEGVRIKEKDLLRASIIRAGIDPEQEMTKGMYDAFADISYNLGPRGFSKILEKSKDENANFNLDLFTKELGTWTGVKDPSLKKGIQIRRISQILMAKGILLPESPEDAEEIFKKLDINMATPNKNIVQKYIKHYSETGSFNEGNLKKVLEQVSTTPMSSPEDFVKILREKL
jgi:GH24 family phage-related lysozyme (muramidase)